MNRLLPFSYNNAPPLAHCHRSLTAVRVLAAISVYLFFTSPAFAQQLTLETVIQRALLHSTQIRVANAQVSVTNGLKLQAIAPPPLSVSYHEEDIAATGSIGEGGQRIYSIAQDFDIPLLTGARGYLYGSLNEAASVRLEYVKRKVRAGVVAAYADLFARQEQLTVERRNAVLAGRFSDAAKKRFEAGATSRLEYLQAKSRNAMAQKRVRDAITARLEAEQRLIAVTGDTTLHAVVASDSLKANIINIDSGMDFTSLLDGHPVVVSAALESEGYSSDRNWRWMEYLPGFSASAFRQEYEGLGNFWGVEFTAHVPIWLFLSPRGSNEQASGYAMEAEARVTSARLEARRVVTLAMQNMESARANLQGYTSSLLSEAEEIQRFADRAMNAGEIGYLEYVAAMEQSNTILIGYFDALTAYYRAAADLQAETGIDIQW